MDAVNVSKMELNGRYQILVCNCPDEKKSTLGIDGYALMFTSKQDVIDHIALLNKALESWGYE